MPITLYVAGTPNGHKAAIAFQELKAKYGLEFTVRSISFTENEQKSEINPNGRIPAIVDHNRGDFAVFESGAILLYLAEHYDPEHILLPADPNERSEVIQWIMWQMGGLGPMQGQAETLRLCSVLERNLADGREYLAARRYTVDIMSFLWAARHNMSAGLNLDAFPLLNAWLHRVAERPAVRAGLEMFGSKFIENDFKHVKLAVRIDLPPQFSLLQY
ncbi:UNVERIFIED_CONTAM: hypothetical protein HDU68_002719 [Siphonaria sp. JEL0065]|nr:hypothetical protein HDU68_002719 [Siphonaria sp. JEL0065]